MAAVIQDGSSEGTTDDRLRGAEHLRQVVLSDAPFLKSLSKLSGKVRHDMTLTHICYLLLYIVIRRTSAKALPDDAKRLSEIPSGT